MPWVNRWRRAAALAAMASAGAVVLTLGAPAAAQAAQAAWTITPGPTTGYGVLNDVFATSPTNAWAVGAQAGGGTGRENQLIEHWNGSTWQVALVPAVSQFSTQLLSVSGTSASDIWAVGDAQTSDSGPYPPEVTLIMHWNGSSWTRVPGPDPGAFVNRLVVVKAFGPSDVWASGFFLNADGQVGTDMTLHWDGTSWSRVVMPDPTMQVAGGTSGRDMWFMSATAPWHFNGTTFTQMPGPVSHKIVAISPSDAWGVANVNGVSQLNHWNGSTWSTVTTLPASDALFGLAALSGSDVWAVGEQALANGNEATLTLRWNGSSWSTVASPNPPQSSFPVLGADAAVAPSTVFAVGQGGGTSGNGTLAIINNNS